MGKVLILANQKGGTAKTTSAVHLAAALRLGGRKVLLVDFDPQGDASAYMGYAEGDGVSINEIMQELVSGRNVSVRDIIRTSEKNGGIDYIPADIELAGAEFYLAPVMARETVLKRLLSQVVDDYDYIVIDCQPSLGILVLNALAAADGVVIPAQTQEFSKKALKAITNIIEQVQRGINPNLKFLGILPTMADNTAMTRDTRKIYEEIYGDKVFPISISRSVTAVYSSRDRKALCFKENSKIGNEYKAFAEEVERRI